MTSTDDEKRNQYVSIWEKAVDTQMHFNEMSVKSRQLGMTFVAAALGLGIVLLSRGEAFSFPIEVWRIRFQLNIAVLLPIAALLALRAVKQLDLNVYHKMLRGAVTFGEDFEHVYMKKIFDLDKGMTEAISHFSRYSDASAKRDSESGKYSYTGDERLTAADKIGKFYRDAQWFLGITAAILFLITNIAYWNKMSSHPNSGVAAQQTAPNVTAQPELTLKPNGSPSQPDQVQEEKVGQQNKSQSQGDRKVE